MSEDEMQPGKTFGHALERIAEGGLLRALAGKPLQLAISRLVTGVVALPEAALQIPVVLLEGIVQRIRSDTEARKQVSATVLKEAKRLAACDESMTARALQRWASGLENKQRNTERVAARTIELMAEQETPQAAYPPSEDFMGPFGDIAENASSDDLVDLLARILAGEIHQPGTFSRRTLQTVSILDQRSVVALTESLPYMLSGNWFLIPPNQRDVWLRRFGILSMVGITSEAGIRTIHHDETNSSAVQMGSKAIRFTCKRGMKGSWFADGANLTLVGMELVTALPKPEELRVREVALGIKEYDFVLKVEICNIIDDGESSNIGDVLEVL